MISSSFFRSLSLSEDLEVPERFAHYRPTRRATPIIQAITASGANMIIAPYGSGKSLAAGVAALHVRNGKDDKRCVQEILPRLIGVDGPLARQFTDRMPRKVRGHVIVLTGHVSNPLAEIAAAINMDRAPKTIEGLAAAIKNGGWDHIAIIWDEFGRHLEGLVAEGRSDELDFVQRLAERASRASAPTMSLNLLLHQNLLAYATRLNETSRTEWRKVEGRFRPFRMVEDSQEIYRLIGDVVAALRPAPVAKENTAAAAVVQSVIAAKWLDGLSDAKSVARVLALAHPLTPGALQILPTLVARVGQNERSLFSFLKEVDLEGEVGVETVYNAFSDAMRTDVGIGGTYRRWIETESARSRAPTRLHREILAAACLFQLGSSGERKRLPRQILELAVTSSPNSAQAVEKAIDNLIEANLLLWRRHNDDVAVWHGADIDVALRVREERDRRAGEFDIKAFLKARFPAPYLRAPRHNAHYGVNRFFAGSYMTAAEVIDGVQPEAGDQDAAIAYVIARDRAEINAVRKAVKNSDVPRTIYVVPHRPLDAESAALELMSLEALRADKTFLASDPMVLTEIEELESVAFEQLATQMRSLLDPRGTTSAWFSNSEQILVSSDQPGTVFASTLFDQWFSQTPKIANEQLMRSHASRTMQTARVRVVSAILERSDRARLGYEPNDRSAEGSIYRTVLEHTGLHRSDDLRFADLDEVADSGLKTVWAAIADFFRIPTERDKPRPFSALVACLEDTPTGVPRAVMSLLIAAGFKRFARTVAIYQDGTYLPDVLGYSFDQMIMNPEVYTVRVVRADIPMTEYLREVCYAFAHARPGADEELIRSARDAITQWKNAVPDSAIRTQRLADPTSAMLNAVLSSSDPIDLLFADLPAAFGLQAPDVKVITEIERARKNIDKLFDSYALEAVQTVNEAFRLQSASTSDLLTVVRDWARCFDHNSMESRHDLRVSDKAVLRKAVETANGRFSQKSFAAALSSILLQRGLEKWDDRTASQFRTALRETRERIEAAALDTTSPHAGLKPVIMARITELNALLSLISDDGDQPTAKLINARNIR